MAALGDMVVRIVGDNADFNAKVDASEKKFNAFAKNLASMGKKLTTFVTLPLVGIGVAAVKSAADLEMQQAAFETMLGSAKEATRLLTDLKDMAAKTPFQLSDLAEAGKTLLNFQVSADKILPTVRQLGDIALGNAEKFQRLSLAFGQSQSAGRLMGQDLLQMINSGFNPLNEIAKVTGETMGELKKRMEGGGVSAAEVAKAFASATAEGGQFFGGMERGAKTLIGQWSTLMDNMAELGRNFADILMPAIRNIIASVSGMVQRFSALDDTSKRVILVVLGLVAAIGPLALGIGKLIPLLKAVQVAIMTTQWATMATGIGLAVAALSIVTVGIIGLVTAMRDTRKETGDLSKMFPELTKRLLGFSSHDVAKRVGEINARIAELNKGIAEAAASPFLLTEKQKANVAAANKELATLKAELQAIGAAAPAAAEAMGAVALSQEQVTAAVTDAIDVDKEKERVSREVVEAYIDGLETESAALAQAAATEIATVEDVARKTAELRAAGEAGREAAHQRELARIKAERSAAISSAVTIVAQLSALATQLSTNRTAALDNEYFIAKKNIEAMLISEEDKAKAIEALDADMDAKRREALREQAKAQKVFAIFDIAINTARAVVSALTAGPILGPILAGVIAALGIAQAAAVASQPLPALARGGIAMPREGGVTATVAEGGQPEAIIPLDRLEDMMAQWPTGGGSEGGDIHLQVMIDAKPILDKIFPATRNRTVLLYSGALVD